MLYWIDVSPSPTTPDHVNLTLYIYGIPDIDVTKAVYAPKLRNWLMSKDSEISAPLWRLHKAVKLAYSDNPRKRTWLTSHDLIITARMARMMREDLEHVYWTARSLTPVLRKIIAEKAIENPETIISVRGYLYVSRYHLDSTRVYNLDKPLGLEVRVANLRKTAIYVIDWNRQEVYGYIVFKKLAPNDDVLRKAIVRAAEMAAEKAAELDKDVSKDEVFLAIVEELLPDAKNITAIIA